MIFKKKIPENITEEYIIKAFHKIRKEGVPLKRKSRTHHVKFENELFPPKYVISVANEFANDRELDSSEFHTHNAKKYLKELGFGIIEE